MTTVSFESTFRPLPVADRWCVHGYYTLCPYAPDGSGRILVAGANLESNEGEVIILSKEGAVLDRFGSNPLHTGFYHTGWWQTWSPCARYVTFQGGTLKEPLIRRRDLLTGQDVEMEGDMEGAPPAGGPILSGLMGMMYAAGYGGGGYQPDQAPAPFQARDQHGLFEYTLDPPKRTLRLTVQEILDSHRDRDWLLRVDREIAQRLGPGEGATLMVYCVRWSPDGSRLLFYFGNHCVDPKRGEPRIAYIMTSDRSLGQIHVAMNLSERSGGHWSWQPGSESLIGYGPNPEQLKETCLVECRFDGTQHRKLSNHKSGGHSSVSPADPDLIVTDAGTPNGGEVVWISRKSGEIIRRHGLPKSIDGPNQGGRNPYRVCLHPVFHPSGERILVNHLPARHAAVAEIGI